MQIRKEVGKGSPGAFLLSVSVRNGGWENLLEIGVVYHIFLHLPVAHMAELQPMQDFLVREVPSFKL